jgi:hypothetical protein
MVGFAYLAVVLVLTTLLWLASRESHTSGEFVFRFPRTLVLTLRVGLLVPALVAWGIYRTFPNPTYVEAITLGVFFGALTLIVFFSLRNASRFRVEIGATTLVVSTGRLERSVKLSDVKRMVVARPWRGRGRLDLFGVENRLLVHIDGGIERFDDLTALLEARVPRSTPVREKDTEGHWSDRYT